MKMFNKPYRIGQNVLVKHWVINPKFKQFAQVIVKAKIYDKRKCKIDGKECWVYWVMFSNREFSLVNEDKVVGLAKK